MNSIRQRLFVTLLVVGMFPVLVSLIANVTLTRRDALTAKHQEQQSLSAELSRGLHGIMQSAVSDLNSISSNPVLMDTGETDEVMKRKQEEFRRLTRIYNIFESISLIDKNGFEIESSEADYTGRRDGTKWFRAAVKGTDQVTLPQLHVADCVS